MTFRYLLTQHKLHFLPECLVVVLYPAQLGLVHLERLAQVFPLLTHVIAHDQQVVFGQFSPKLKSDESLVWSQPHPTYLDVAHFLA